MKKPIPNLQSITGISSDFRFAFGNLSNYLERLRENDPPRTRYLARRAFLHRAIPRYEEHFDPEVYADVVTDTNRDIVAKINSIVDIINIIRLSNMEDKDQLNALEQELLSVISGRQCLDQASQSTKPA